MARSGWTRHTLRERETELAALEQQLKSAVGGTGNFSAVVGPPGIGKSSLLSAASESGQHFGMQVFHARATELEQSFGFGVVRQLFESTVRTAGTDRLEAISRGAAGRAVNLIAGLTVDDGPLALDGLLSMTNSVYWMIANLSDHTPLLLIVDDLHWADDESIAVLEFLQARVWELPVAVVLASRPDLGESASRLVQSTNVINPDPLSVVAVEHLIRESLGDPDAAFTDAAASVSGGNPFYLTELIAALAAEHTTPTGTAAAAVRSAGPVAVGRSVAARLSRLSTDAQAVARAVLVLGDQAPAIHVAAFAGVQVENVRRAATKLVTADIFGSSGDLEFAHPILRSALSDVAGEHSLSEGHARAIDLLEAFGADPEVVAAHVMATPPAADPAAVDRLVRAAQVASSRGASGAAVAYLRRALEEPPSAGKRADVLLALGSAEIPLQDPACFFHLLEARDLFPAGPERAEAGLAVTRVLAFAGEISMALAEGAKARGFDRETDLFLDAVTMAASMTGRDNAGVAEIVVRTENLSGDTPGERAALALAAFIKTKSAMPLADIGPMVERVIANGGVTIAAADGFSPSCVLACVNFAGQHRRSITLCTQLIQEAERSGSPFFRAQYAAIRAGGLFRLGRLVESAADARFAIETAGAMNVNLPIAHMTLVESLIALGRLDEAQEAVAALPAPGAREDSAMRASATWTHGHLLAERGDLDAGIAAVRESGRLIDDVGATNPTIIPWRIALVDLLARNGQVEQAREAALPALEAARRHGGSWAIGSLLRGLAMTDRDDAATLLTEAVEALADGESQFALAQALVDLGAEHRRRGKRRQAREPLAEGLRLARECGAGPLAARAELELHAGGAQPRTTFRIGLDSLTPSEWRVAQLAALGGGNRDIAQSLFVTEKTVEKHLGNAYRKLGITKRSQLTPLLRASDRLVEE